MNCKKLMRLNRERNARVARENRNFKVSMGGALLVGMVLLPLLIVAFLLSPKAMTGFVAAAAFPCVLMDAKGEAGGGGAGLSDDFEEKVMKGIGGIEDRVKNYSTKTDQLVQNFDNLTKETKKCFEDLTKLKDVANATDSGFKETVRKIGEIQTQLRREVKMAWGDPVKRIQSDEELRFRFNAAIRLAIDDNSGTMRKMVLNSYGETIKKALGEDSSPGSTLINQQLLSEIYDTLATYGIWNTFGVRRLGTKTTIMPVKTARVVALAIISEGTQITDDANKAGTTVTATVVDIAALLNVYNRLIQDAEFDVTADVLNDFSEACAYRLDWFCTQADGGADTTDGGMTGIFGGGGTDVDAAAGATSVGKTTLEDWINTILGVDAAVLSRPARWWMHPQQIVRALLVRDANGRSIFLNAMEAPAQGGIGSILGYPVTPGHVCPSTDAVSTRVAAFGDPNGQVVGIRNDFSVVASEHFKFDYNQTSFRVIGRAATKIRKSTAFGVLKTAAA